MFKADRYESDRMNRFFSILVRHILIHSLFNRLDKSCGSDVAKWGLLLVSIGGDLTPSRILVQHVSIN